MRKIYFFSSSFLFAFCLLSLQQDLNAGTLTGEPKWAVNINNTKVFIENKGQFNGKDNLPGSAILFGMEDGGAQVYFTPAGLTYRIDKIEAVREKETREMKEEERIKNVITQTICINLEWIDANPSAKIVAADTTLEYFNYMDGEDPVNKSIYYARGFKKLIYKDLYPGIDAEYIFHPETGIKYTLKVHPGADASKIKMRYTGADNIYRDADGNIHVVTPLGDFIDHQPVSFYEPIDLSVQKTIVPSSFTVKDNIVSFNIPEYDPAKVLIIDPWVVTPVGLTTNIKGFDLQTDESGNIYIYGGFVNYKVQKYTSAGTLLWTFNTAFSSYFGDLAVEPNGNVYITEGCCVGNRAKIDPAGVVVWVNSGGYEYWNVAFTCSGKKLVVGGAGASIANINLKTGAFTNVTNIGPTEVRSMAIGPNGNVYNLTCNLVGLVGNYLIATKPNFAALYSINSTYAWPETGVSYTNSTLGGFAGQNGIAVDHQFIYTTNGSQVDKRDKATGTIILSTLIPGGILENNSGIAVDSCGNVYVGSQLGIYKLDNNLIPLGSAPTTGAVYDVKIGSGGEILATGNGFVGSFLLLACIPVPCCPPFTLNFNATPASCNAKDGSATVTVSGGNAPYAYSWNTLPVKTTQTVNNLAPGIYTVRITDANGCITTGTVTVPNQSGMAAAITDTVPVYCNGTNSGSATVTPTGGTGPYTYSWNTVPEQTTQTATGLSVGTYVVTVKDVNGCEVIATVTIEEPFPLKAQLHAQTNVFCNGDNTGTASADASGGIAPYSYSWDSDPPQYTQVATGLQAGTYILTVTDSAGCQDTQMVVITEGAAMMADISQTDVSCFGNNDGSATVNSITNGEFPYTYTWNTSPAQTGPTAVNLNSGTYTVTIRDANNCEIMETVFINGPDPLDVQFSTSDILCNGDNTGYAVVTPSGGTSPYAYEWNTTPVQTEATAVNLSAGNYTVIVTDNNGCQESVDVTITEPPLPLQIEVSQTDEICAGKDGSARAVATGGTPPYQYSWNTIPPVTSDMISNLGSGNYIASVIDNNGCTAVSAPVTVSNIDENCFYFYIPNAFSPNGDHDNNEFKGTGKGLTEYKLSIYNRWGERIFETTKLEEGWNGGLNNDISRRVINGAYIFIARVRDNKGKWYDYMGTVSLIE